MSSSNSGSGLWAAFILFPIVGAAVLVFQVGPEETLRRFRAGASAAQNGYQAAMKSSPRAAAPVIVEESEPAATHPEPDLKDAPASVVMPLPLPLPASLPGRLPARAPRFPKQRALPLKTVAQEERDFAQLFSRGSESGKRSKNFWVEGEVFDLSSLAPVSGALIEFHDEDSSRSFSVKTDSLGRYFVKLPDSIAGYRTVVSRGGAIVRTIQDWEPSLKGFPAPARAELVGDQLKNPSGPHYVFNRTREEQNISFAVLSR